MLNLSALHYLSLKSIQIYSIEHKASKAIEVINIIEHNEYDIILHIVIFLFSYVQVTLCAMHSHCLLWGTM